MNLLIRYSRPLLIGLIIGTIAIALGLLQLRINFSFESFYPKSDPEFEYYQSFQEKFTEDQNFIVYLAVVSPEADIFDQAFLQQANALFEELNQLQGVDSMLTATRLLQLRRRGLGVSSKPYLQFDSPEAVEASRKRIQKDTTLIGNFITRDRRAVCAYLFINEEIFDSRDRDLLNYEIQRRVEASGFEHVLSGIPYIRTQYIDKIGKELGLFTALAISLITLVLFLTYRNFWGVVIPMAAVVISLIWILGIMGATDQSINLISNLLIPIMFVVGTSDVIHLTTKYLHELRDGLPPFQAMRKTLQEIGPAIFLTSVTTAVGFASLLISRITPIRDFGLYAAIGVLITYVISIIILPGGLLRLPAQIFLKSKSFENSGGWDKWLYRLHNLTLRSEKTIAWSAVAVLALCFYLITQVSTDSFLIEDIGKNDPIRKSMEFFERETYGLRPFEMGIHVKDTSLRVTDREILVEMARMQAFLQERESFSPFISLATFVQEGNYLYHSNRDRYRKIPDSQDQVDELIAYMELNDGGSLLEQVISPDQQTARLSSRLPDIGTNAFEALYADLENYVNANCDTTLFSYRPTGHAFLTEHNLKYVRQSLLGGLGIAFVIVGIIMGLLFRSWKMLLISMVPNVIPLLLTGGVMGLFGITLTASTALVFVIAFGIAVDDTIHFLTRYRLERSRGNDVETSIKHTLLGTGKAMIITSIILMGGFIILVASDFGGTFNTGLFTALTIVFALVSDLLLLPILVRWVDRD